MDLTVVILAAGKGRRMNSNIPKVLHEVAGRPMLAHVLNAAQVLDPAQIITIVGHGQGHIKAALPDAPCEFVEQLEQLGTAHAMRQALPHIKGSRVLILLGDVPLIKPETLAKFIKATPKGALGLLSYQAPDPTGFGRIIRDDERHITAVVEERDATEKQKLITEVASGIYLAQTDDLKTWLPQVTNNNASGEYYLPDIVPMAVAAQGVMGSVLNDPAEALGVNNMAQLAMAERMFQQRQVQQLMGEGVTVIDPARLDIRGTVKAGKDVIIDVNVILSGDVILGDNVKIGAGSILTDVTIADNSYIRPYSIVESATIGQDNIIGPYARIRPGTETQQGVHIGNFVEVKKSKLGAHTKANHLSYLGDATIGQDVNIGAGTITCNYNGVEKFETIIEDEAFIGSNSSLVAPITIGERATVGAGSVITKDAPKDELTVTRSKQTSFKDWSRPQKADKSA